MTSATSYEWFSLQYTQHTTLTTGTHSPLSVSLPPSLSLSVMGFTQMSLNITTTCPAFAAGRECVVLSAVGSAFPQQLQHNILSTMKLSNWSCINYNKLNTKQRTNFWVKCLHISIMSTCAFTFQFSTPWLHLLLVRVKVLPRGFSQAFWRRSVLSWKGLNPLSPRQFLSRLWPHHRSSSHMITSTISCQQFFTLCQLLKTAAE